MAKVEVNPKYCKACNYCVKACPKGVLVLGTKTNSMGYHYAVPAKPEECVGCKLCATACPDAAIEVYR